MRFDVFWSYFGTPKGKEEEGSKIGPSKSGNDSLTKDKCSVKLCGKIKCIIHVWGWPHEFLSKEFVMPLTIDIELEKGFFL